MKDPESDGMPLSDAMRHYGRKEPETYRIVVSGLLDPEWSDRLGGLRIEPLPGCDADAPATVLEGRIRDQAQLSGILNTLYEMRYTLISVELLKTASRTEPPHGGAT